MVQKVTIPAVAGFNGERLISDLESVPSTVERTLGITESLTKFSYTKTLNVKCWIISKTAPKNLSYLLATTSPGYLPPYKPGTSKTHTARLIPALSPHATSPFMQVNFTEFASPIFESELFGYEEEDFH